MFKTVDGELKVFNKTILSTQNNLKNLQTQTANLSYYTAGGNHVNLQNVPIAQPQTVSNFTKLNNAFKVYNDNLTKSTGLQNAYIKSVGGQNQALGNYLARLNGAKASMGGYIASLAKAKLATIGLRVATLALNVGLTLGITTLISGIAKMIGASEEMSQQASEATSKYKEQAASIDEYKNKIAELKTALNDENISYSEARDKRSQLLDIQKQLIDTYGVEASGIDLVNGSLDDQINKLDTLNKQKRQEWENEVNKLSSGQQWQKWSGAAGLALLDIVTLDWTLQDMDDWLADFDNKTNIERVQEKVENFKKSISLSDLNLDSEELEKLKSQLESFNGVSFKGNKMTIAGDAKTVQDTITQIQTQVIGSREDLRSLDQDLKDVYNSAKKIVDENWDTYNTALQNQILDDKTGLEYYGKLTEAYETYQEAVKDGDEKTINEAKEGYSKILSDIAGSDMSDSFKKFFENMYPDISDIVDDWKFEVDIVPKINTNKDGLKDDIETVKALTTEEISAAFENNGTGVSKDEWEAITNLNAEAQANGLDLTTFLEQLREAGYLVSQLDKDIEKAVNDTKNKYGNGVDWGKYFKDNSIDTQEEIDKWNEVTNGIDNAEDAMNAYANASSEVNKMTVSLSDLEGASDKIGKLSSAFKELSDDGHITTKTLGEIKTATGLADDEWAGYESTLLNAKKGSSEFSQAMSDLTYKILEHEMGAEKLANATEEQIAAILRENGVLNANAVAESIVIAEKNKKLSQSTELAQAYLYEKIGVEELTKKTEDEIGALLTEANIESTVEQRTYLLAQAKDALRFKTALAKATTAEEVVALAMEASQAGITGNALNDLILDIGIFNNTNLDVSQKVAALQEMGYYAHWTAQGLSNIDKVKKYSLGGKNYIASYDKDGKLAWVEKEKEIDVPKVEIPKITIPNYSGAASGSKGSGSDNKPDYEDPTDAIINRINLRSKEIEKQEEEIQNLIEIAELEKDYEKQISLANDLISTRKKRVEELNTANAALNNEAEYLRNSNSWDEDSWFDSQGNATEAYYALFNASSKEQQDQIKYLFEKIGKYKKAYQDNAKEIIALNKEIIQDERETIPQLWENLMDDSVSDIEHRIELRNNLVSPDYESNIADYEEIKRLAHLRADAWREAGYGEDSEEVQKWQKTWWDAENSILDENRKIFDERLQLSEDYIQHSKDFGWENGDNEIKARKRVLDWIQSDYYKSLIKDDKEYYKILEEHRLNYLEAQKEEFDKANNFGSSVLDSRKTLLQSYFDATNSIVEAQHEINKELEASKTMYEWLDEDTRRLLFNQEDYNTLSEELYDIQYKADKLKRQYERDLNNSTLETVESITSNYQMQYETLMKSYEIAKADLEIAKKKQKLNNVLNERNVRMFIDGQWKWVANTEDVINAKSELADAEYAKRVEESGLTQQESINNLTKQQDELGVIINKFENGVIDLDDAVKMATQAIGRMPSALSSMYSNASQNNVSSGSSYSSGRVLQVGNDGKAPAGATVGDTIVTAGGNYKIVPAGTSGAKYNPASGHYSIKVGAVSSGSSGGSGSGSSRNPISSNKSGINISTVYIKQKKAKGTGYTQSGSMLAGEDGEEIFVDNNGHLIPVLQPTIFKDIEAGGKVFNTEQMKNLRPLWDLSNLNFGNSSFMSNIQPQQVSHAQDNRIIINGLTVDNGSTDGQALISALRRYVGNH